MDFGLLSSTKKGRRGLRDELVYPSSYIYYFVILEDIVGRFSWLIGFLIIQVNCRIMIGDYFVFDLKSTSY